MPYRLCLSCGALIGPNPSCPSDRSCGACGYDPDDPDLGWADDDYQHELRKGKREDETTT